MTERGHNKYSTHLAVTNSFNICIFKADMRQFSHTCIYVCVRMGAGIYVCFCENLQSIENIPPIGSPIGSIEWLCSSYHEKSHTCNLLFKSVSRTTEDFAICGPSLIKYKAWHTKPMINVSLKYIHVNIMMNRTTLYQLFNGLNICSVTR